MRIQYNDSAETAALANVSDFYFVQLVAIAKVAISFILLAPTGALIVMMVYYISGSGSNFFRFSLSPLMQLMLQVSLYVA